MDKKLTTTLGIALGASLLAAGAGLGIYKYFSKKLGSKTGNDSVGAVVRKSFVEGFIGNGLIKSNSLYGGVENGLVGGGLYKEQAA